MADLWPIQQTVYGILSADGDYDVYDGQPSQGTAYPYVVIGLRTKGPPLIGELDGDESEGTITFHSWSAFKGADEVYPMHAWIRGLLHRQAVAGTWAVTEEFEEVSEDPSSTEELPLFHGVLRYRVHTN